MYAEKTLIDGELVEIRFSRHAEERAVERGVHLGQIEDLIVINFDKLMDSKLGEEIRLSCHETGVVAPVSIDVIETFDDWLVTITVHTTWINNKLIKKENIKWK